VAAADRSSATAPGRESARCSRPVWAWRRPAPPPWVARRERHCRRP